MTVRNHHSHTIRNHIKDGKAHMSEQACAGNIGCKAGSDAGYYSSSTIDSESDAGDCIVVGELPADPTSCSVVPNSKDRFR